MNIKKLVQVISLAIKNRKKLDEIIPLVSTILSGAKSGWKTTEFWGKLVVQGLVLYNAFVADKIDPSLGLKLVTSLEGLYIAGRTAYKVGREVKKQATDGK